MLTDVCRVLELNDVVIVVPAIQRMVKVLQAMQPMESLIREVLNTVKEVNGGGIGGGGGRAENVQESLRDLLPTLRDMGEKLRELERAKMFRRRLENALEGEIGGAEQIEEEEEGRARHTHTSMQDEEIVDKIVGLVKNEELNRRLQLDYTKVREGERKGQKKEMSLIDVLCVRECV